MDWCSPLPRSPRPRAVPTRTAPPLQAFPHHSPASRVAVAGVSAVQLTFRMTVFRLEGASEACPLPASTHPSGTCLQGVSSLCPRLPALGAHRSLATLGWHHGCPEPTCLEHGGQGCTCLWDSWSPHPWTPPGPTRNLAPVCESKVVLDVWLWTRVPRAGTRCH